MIAGRQDFQYRGPSLGRLVDYGRRLRRFRLLRHFGFPALQFLLADFGVVCGMEARVTPGLCARRPTGLVDPVLATLPKIISSSRSTWPYSDVRCASSLSS